LTQPAVHWPRVLADLAQALSCSVGEPLARQLGVPAVLVRCWLAGAEPARRDRDMLLARWRVLTGRPVEFVPLQPATRPTALPASVAIGQPSLASPLLGPLNGAVPQPVGATASIVHWLRSAQGAWVKACDLRQDARRPDVFYTPQEVGSCLAKMRKRRQVETDAEQEPMQYRLAVQPGRPIRLHFRVRTAT
jgi:hypothetical protein